MSHSGTLHTESCIGGSLTKCAPGHLAAVMCVGAQLGRVRHREGLQIRPSSFILLVTNGIQVQKYCVEATVNELCRCVFRSPYSSGPPG